MTQRLKAGARLGPYLLEAELGRGAMAVVFRAAKSGAMDFRKTVALKVVLPEHSHDQTFIDSLIDEARLGGFLNHPNLVQVFEFECIEGTYCMAMEYVDGVTLAQAIKSHPADNISPGAALRIAMDVCSGLSHAHWAVDDRGRPLHLVHRDLKPSNILLSRQGQAKILDFGMARSESQRRVTQTSTGVIKGTPLYMSPEQVLTQKLDARSDIFSLCTVLAQMIIGRRVFQGQSVFEVVTAIATGQVADALKEVAEVVPDLVPVLERGWSVDPARRPRDAQALGMELLEICSRLDERSIAEVVAACEASDAAVPANTATALESGPAASDTNTLLSCDLPAAAAPDPPQPAPTRLSKKVCMLGAFGVGKTSLVARFVHSMFSERYKTTVGVKIDKKLVRVDDSEVTMVLWDLHGDDKLRQVRASHLKGASGYLLVVDGTRRSSLETALEMRERLAEATEGLPFVVAINKADLREQWELGDPDVDSLRRQGMQVTETSAKDGLGVERVFADLARLLVS